jgi:hypothetical protein
MKCLRNSTGASMRAAAQAGVSNPAQLLSLFPYMTSNFVRCSIEDPFEVLASFQIARLLLYRAVLIPPIYHGRQRVVTCAGE